MRQVQRWAEVQFQNTNKLGFIIKLSSCYIPPVTKIELKLLKRNVWLLHKL